MNKTRHTSNAESIDSDLPATTIFELLTNERRQRALEYLTQAVGAVPISDLADQLTLLEGDHTCEQYERVCTSLVHVHLPKMADAGVVEYDPARETVNPQAAIEQITPYLELAGLSES